MYTREQPPLQKGIARTALQLDKLKSLVVCGTGACNNASTGYMLSHPSTRQWYFASLKGANPNTGLPVSCGNDPCVLQEATGVCSTCDEEGTYAFDEVCFHVELKLQIVIDDLSWSADLQNLQASAPTQPPTPTALPAPTNGSNFISYSSFYPFASNISNYLGYLEGEVAANDEDLPVGGCRLDIFGTRTASAVSVSSLTLGLSNGSSYDIDASGEVSSKSSASPSRRKLLQVGHSSR